MIILGSPFGFAPGTMQSAIERAGLTNGLKLCVDASDLASYSGSGQNWLDTSGNGYDFYRGTGSGSDAADPTFNGVAGGQSSSEYWSLDGSDYFTYDTTNEAWMNNLHKAGAVFTLATWIKTGAFGAIMAVLGDRATSGTGISFQFDPSKNWFISVRNTGAVVLSKGSSTIGSLVTEGAWCFLTLAFSDAGSIETGANGTFESSSTGVTYSSPSSGAASSTMTIGATGGTSPMSAGTQIAALAVWEGRMLSSAELLSVYNTTKAKFGL